MRSPAYWGGPQVETAALREWVSDGFRALYPESGASPGVVQVRAYTRDGLQVAAHSRQVSRHDGLHGVSDPSERPGPQADPALRQRCDRQAERDEAMCRRVSRASMKLRMLCWASVQLRYGACISGQSIPSLALPE